MPQLDVSVFALAVGTLFIVFMCCLVLVQFGIRRMLRVRVARFYFSSLKFLRTFERLFLTSYARRFTRSGALGGVVAPVAQPPFCHQRCAAWSQLGVASAAATTDHVLYPMESCFAAHCVTLGAAGRLNDNASAS